MEHRAESPRALQASLPSQEAELWELGVNGVYGLDFPNLSVQWVLTQAVSYKSDCWYYVYTYTSLNYLKSMILKEAPVFLQHIYETLIVLVIQTWYWWFHLVNQGEGGLPFLPKGANFPLVVRFRRLGHDLSLILIVTHCYSIQISLAFYDGMERVNVNN